MANANFMTLVSADSTEFSSRNVRARRAPRKASFENGVPGLTAIESQSVIGEHNGVLDDDLFDLFSKIED